MSFGFDFRRVAMAGLALVVAGVTGVAVDFAGAARPFEHHHLVPLLGELLRDHRSAGTRADNHDVGFDELVTL